MNTFTVSEMFGDHMVLCHSRENPVWGTAAPGGVVQIRLGEYSAETAAGPDGRWQTLIQTPGAGEITEMALRCGQEEIAFRDVACGEVWLAGGQSNMEMPVLAVHGAKEMARAESYPNVRLRTIPRRCRAEKQFGWHFQPMDGTDSGWLLPSEQAVAKFSAIGYGFAAGLAEKLGMPVGIIDMSWGGTVIQAWMPQEELLAHDDTRRDVERFQARRAALGEEAERSFLRNQASLRAVLERTPDFVECSLEDMKYYTRLEREIDWPPEAAVGDPNEPGSLFAHMVAATAPYGIRGVLWYQGESNALVGEAGRYAGLFARMRESWQQAWGRPLPFLTCQLATFDPFIWGGGYDWVTLREQQALCARTMEGVSMAVLVDAGEEKDIHPHEKRVVARRLLDLALRDVYGEPVWDVFPPEPVGCTRQGDILRVTFTGPVELRPGGDGLKILTDTGLVPCEATLVDDCTLEIAAPDGLGVAYGRSEWFIPSLFGRNGAPVGPFSNVTLHP